MSSPAISVKVTNLLAREQRRSPLGQPANPNRDIGFASVFLQLENNQEAEITVTVQKIEIRDAVTSAVIMSNTIPQTIRLRSLEHAVNDFQLTNKTGYGECDRVQAIVTYQIADQVQVIETAAVTIEQM